MMVKNNLSLAYRHLSRHKVSTTLHVVGLTLGMTSCLIIGLFLRHELTYDAYHTNASKTYRINSLWVDSGKESYHFSTPLPLADALRHETTGLDHITLAHPLEHVTIDVSEKRFNERNILVVDPEFVNVFNVEAVEGDPAKILAKPYQALITETIARKYFGNENPIGRIFKLNDQFDITVGGLIKDLPGNTHLSASMLLSFVPNEKFLHNGLDGWTYVSGTETFVVLHQGDDLSTLKKQLKSIADRNINSDPNLPKFSRSYFDIQPLKSIHLDTKYAGGGPWVQAINPSWLWFFGLIGALVLILACINFMNLSTAQAMQRAREVGVRKSIGAARSNLIMQFLTEAWLLTIFSGILSISITQLVLPVVNTLIEKSIVFNLFDSPMIMTWLGVGILLTGVLAGLYPAWVISRFNPARTLKASISMSGDSNSSLLRKVLVVTQFSISAGLLISLILIAQQVNLLRNSNLGFDKENILTVPLGGTDKTETFIGELMKIPQVKDVSCATNAPSSQGHWSTILSRISRSDPNRKSVTLILADEHYLKMYGIALKAGRGLLPSDTNSVARSIPEDKQIIKAVVNETLIRSLGFDSNEAAIGEMIWTGFRSGKAEIVGVMADFNTGSLHAAIEPTLVTQNRELAGNAGIKVGALSNLPSTIGAIEKIWKQTYPKGVFEFKFLDDQIDAFYNAEEQLYQLFKIFSATAMLISCLGLWGLATFAAQQRTKEVGIRKVLGASVNEIILLLSRDFVVLVIGALIIASPLAYYLVHNWLRQFAYRIDIGWVVFIYAGVISLGITLVTVSFQAFRAAIANPVVALKNE